MEVQPFRIWFPNGLAELKSEKIEKYRTYACHELHFFICRKDREFFDKIIRPYLENKKEPTFLDDWFCKGSLCISRPFSF